MATEDQSKAISVRVKHAHRSKYTGQRRHDLRIGKQPSYVQERPKQPNRVLLEMPAPATMSDRAKALRKLTGPTRTMRADAAIATIGIITFGTAAQAIFRDLTTDQQDAAYLEIAETIAQECKTILRGLVVHEDETAPHAHVVWDTRDQDGTPMSRIMKGSRLQDIAAEVIDRHAPGIVRGERKTVRQERGDAPSKTYNRSVKQLHEDLPREIAAKQAQLGELLSRIDEMQARVAKLEARGDLNAKEQKRLDTYRKRLAARVEEYSAAREALLQRDAEASEREAALGQRSEALDIKGRTLDAAERELDQREDDLDAREQKLERREVEVTKLARYLQDAKDAVSSMIGDVADRLGVGASLRAIMDRIRTVEHNLEQPDDDMSPS